jgi:hypothetical protein
MDANLRNILLGVLVLTIGIYLFKVTAESFDNPPPVSDETHAQVANAHKAVPAVDEKVVESSKASIRNMITERPDVILTIKKVLADPLIKKTLADILYGIRR